MNSEKIINFSKAIINISNTYIVDRDKKDEKIISLVNAIKGNLTKATDDKEVYALSLFLQALNTTKAFKDVLEKDKLMEKVFNLI